MKSVVRNHHWAPEIMGALYFDSQDIHGLLYWYADVIQAEKDLKNQMEEAKKKGKK